MSRVKFFLDEVLAKVEAWLEHNSQRFDASMVNLYQDAARNILPTPRGHVDEHNAFMRTCEDLRGVLQHLYDDPNTTVDQRAAVQAAREGLRRLMIEAGHAMYAEMDQVVGEVRKLLDDVRLL